MLQPLIGRYAPVLLMLAVVACGPGSTSSPSAAAPTTAPAAVAATASTTGQNTGQATATAPAVSLATGQEAPATTRLNLNAASTEDFLTIPGVGERMVREFQEYRPYVSILQFRREIGKYVDAQQVAEYEKYVYVPIAVNDADVATLQQIPGLDETEAAALVAARPFASNDAFLGQLAQYVSETELPAAEAYLSNP